jgi:hypothetical protein
VESMASVFGIRGFSFSTTTEQHASHSFAPKNVAIEFCRHIFGQSSIRIGKVGGAIAFDLFVGGTGGRIDSYFFNQQQHDGQPQQQWRGQW